MVGTRNWSDTEESLFFVTRPINRSSCREAREGGYFRKFMRRKDRRRRKKREKRLCKMIDAIVRYDRVRNIRNREEANEIDQRERDFLDRPSGIGCSFNDQ